MSSLSTPTILILDDDELWLARHERRLKQAGFDCYTTHLAKDAIRALKTNPAIKFALIDEVLYVPPVPVDETEREFQQPQGIGVIREVNKQRSDVQFIIVTAAPHTRSDGDAQVFRRETTKLRRHQGVIDIIHKLDIEDDPESTYGWLIDLLKRSQIAIKAEVVMPKILIGLGFTKTEHEAVAEHIGINRRRYMPIAPLLKEGNTSKLLDNFWDRAKEKIVLLEMPGSKKLDRLTNIKPNTQAFEILSFLAKQAEKKQQVVIREQDYKHSSRKTRKRVDSVPVYDPREKQDFMFEYGKDGRRLLRTGVQIEGKLDQNSPLKVAIHRLRNELQKLNVGPQQRLFTYDQEGYHPAFELGIVVYAIRSTKEG